MKKNKAYSFLCAACALAVSSALTACATAADSSAAVTKDFHTWAPTPPMGWNSFDCFGLSLTEAQAKEQAEAMVKYLKPFGYNVFTIDHQWYSPSQRGFQSNPRAVFSMDKYGRFIPAENRFPSSAGGKGLKPLADYMHSKGLKIGVHLMRGIPRQAVNENCEIKGTSYHAGDIANRRSTCAWNQDMYGVDMTKPGAQEYYNSVFEQFAEWGLDFVKVDDLSRPYATAEIEAIRKAIDNCGRPIIFSLSPGDTPVNQGAHVNTVGNMWRISDDFWDRWDPLKGMFGRLHRWEPYRKQGSWPDADMLPFGVLEFTRNTRFTKDEQQLCMTLWCIGRSPLIFGGDMTKMDEFTLNLLTNKDVLAVNQNSENNRQLFQDGDFYAWVADVPKSKDKYVALFNTQTKGYSNYDLKKAAATTERGVGRQGVPSATLKADIKGAKVLALLVSEDGQGKDYAHAAWINPTLSGPAGTKKLTELRWKSATAGWGNVQVNKTSDGQAIDGIGTHAESLITYDIPEGYDTFTVECRMVDGTENRNRLKFSVLTEKAMNAPAADSSEISVKLSDLGFTKVSAKNLWTGKDLGTFTDTFKASVKCHGGEIFRISPK